MDIIVIGHPGTGHSYGYTARIQRAMESAEAANEGRGIIIINNTTESTSSNQSTFGIMDTYHITCRYHDFEDLKYLKELDDLTWIKLNRESVPKPYQYKRIFISKPNNDLIKVIKSKGFIRQRIYH